MQQLPEQRGMGILAPTRGVTYLAFLPAAPARQHQYLIAEEHTVKPTLLECVLTHASW